MKFFIIVVLIFAIGILSVECKGRVYNGSISDADQFRFQVKIFIQVFINNELRTFKCGGSIIHEKWSLSASHCFDGFDVRNVNVSMGLKENNAYIKNVTAIKFILHEHYQALNTTLLNDIALVKTPKDECIKRYIRIIPLCRSYVVDGTDVTVSGWGLTENGTAANELRYAHLVLNSTACNTGLPEALDPTQLCTYEKTQNPCSGDSGGPLFVGFGNRAIQVGIVSYGFARCSPDLPAVFTRISAFVPWIQNKTNFAIRTELCN